MANLSNINNKFLVTTGGNVLIGQTSAIGSSILQVTGSVNITGGTTSGLNITTSGTQDTININRAASNDNAMTKYQTASADKWIVGLRNTSDDNFRFYSYGTSSDVLTIDQANGNATFTGAVGVGVSAGSNAKLEVVSTSGEVFRADSSGGAFRLVVDQTGVNTQGVLTHTGSATFSGIITANSSSSGDYVRMYGSSGTGKWDIYGNGANLRISDNESAGILAVDTGATFGGNVKLTDEKILGLRTSTTDYALQYRDLDFRLIGSADGTTQRKFSFGYYTSDNPAGTWNGKTYINSYTGNVGIGTTSPTASLGIKANFAANGSYTTDGWARYLVLDAENTGGGGILWTKQSSTYNRAILNNQGKMEFGRSTANDASAAWISDLAILPSGDVCIGTITPSSNNNYGTGDLNVENNTFASAQIFSHNSTVGNYSFLGLGKSSGTGASPTIVVAQETVASIGYYGYDGSGYKRLASIDGVVDGTPGAGDMPGRLTFSTTVDGASTPTERMRISNSGNITKPNSCAFSASTTTPGFFCWYYRSQKLLIVLKM